MKPKKFLYRTSFCDELQPSLEERSVFDLLSLSKYGLRYDIASEIRAKIMPLHIEDGSTMMYYIRLRLKNGT